MFSVMPCLAGLSRWVQEGGKHPKTKTKTHLLVVREQHNQGGTIEAAACLNTAV
jgi:hypothetical protein